MHSLAQRLEVTMLHTVPGRYSARSVVLKHRQTLIQSTNQSTAHTQDHYSDIYTSLKTLVLQSVVRRFIPLGTLPAGQGRLSPGAARGLATVQVCRAGSCATWSHRSGWCPAASPPSLYLRSWRLNAVGPLLLIPGRKVAQTTSRRKCIQHPYNSLWVVWWNIFWVNGTQIDSEGIRYMDR